MCHTSLEFREDKRTSKYLFIARLSGPYELKSPPTWGPNAADVAIGDTIREPSCILCTAVSAVFPSFPAPANFWLTYGKVSKPAGNCPGQRSFVSELVNLKSIWARPWPKHLLCVELL